MNKSIKSRGAVPVHAGWRVPFSLASVIGSISLSLLSSVPIFAVNHPVISAFAIGIANATTEYIEIYNPTLDIWCISGATAATSASALSDKTLTTITTNCVAPGSYLLLANELNQDLSNRDISFPDSSVTGSGGWIIYGRIGNGGATQKLDSAGWGSLTGDPSPFVETTAFSAGATLNTNDVAVRKVTSNSTAGSMQNKGTPGSEANQAHAFDTDNNSTNFVLMSSATYRPHSSVSPPAGLPPASISDLTALPGSIEGSVRLAWTAPGDNGTSGNITNGNYWFRFSTAQISDFNNPPSPFQQLIISTNISNPTTAYHGIVITGLTPSTTYFFSLVTYDGNFTTATWSTAGFNTLNSTPAADFVPATPAGLSALPDSLTSIKLSWSSNTESDLNSYEIQFSSFSQSDGFQSLGTFSTTTLSTVHSTAFGSALVTNNTYFYVIRAKDNTNHFSAFSSTQSNFPRIVPPAAPTGLGIDLTGTTTIQIKWVWNDLANNETSYMLLSDTTTLQSVSGNLSANTTFFTETGLQPNTSYFRAVRVSNSVGSAFSNFITSYTLANPPTGFAFVEVNFTSVTVSWGQNNNPGITRYELSQSLDNFQTNFSTPITFLTGFTGNTTSQTGLLPGTNYSFRVRAYNGNDLPTTFASGNTTTKIDSDPPNAITDLTLSTWNASVGAIRLTWSAPADAPNNLAVNGYLVRWNTQPFGNTDFSSARAIDQSLIPSSPKNPGAQETMVITGFPSGTVVYFHVKSSDVSNNVSAVDTNAPSILVPPHILISEVQAKGAFASQNEFVELYNASTSPINLNGMTLVGRGETSQSDTLLHQWTTDTLVKGLAYYLWANGNYSNIPVIPDVTDTPTAGIVDNGGVALRLGSVNSGPMVDSLAWGTANNGLAEKTDFATSPGNDQSLERKPGAASPNAGNGTDSNDNSQDFALRTSVEMQNSRSPREPDTFIPGSISNLTALQGVNDGEINLVWTAPGNDGTEIPLLGSYLIKFSTSGVITQANFDSISNSVSISTSGVLPVSSSAPIVGRLFTGLTAGGTYFFAIKAQDQLNQISVWNSSVDVVTVNTLAGTWAQDLRPAVPSSISMDGRASGSIFLSWSASTATDLNGYQVYYATWSQASFSESNKNYNGTGAALGNSPVSAGNVTNFVLSGLVDGQVYYLAVKSVDKTGNTSIFTSEISTSAIAAVPVAPSPLTPTALSVSSIRWSWRAVPTAQNYFIYAGTVTTPNNGTSATFGPIAHPTSFFIQTALSVNSSAQFYVTAVNATGESAKSNVVSSFTLANPPSISSFSFVGLSSVTLQLNANSNPSNTVFEISQSKNAFASDISTPVPFSSNVTTTTITATGLSSDTNYSFRVRAQNGDGIPTAPSSVLAAKTGASPVADHLVISEIEVTPDQFLEIYNPTSSDISLNGWQVVRRSAGGSTVTTLITFSSNHTVKAHSYFLFGSLGYAGTVTADAIGTDSYSTSTDGSLQLKDATGAIVDAVGMGTITDTTAGVFETQTTVRPASGQSIERKANLASTASTMQGGVDDTAGNGLDTNNNNNDFITRTTPGPQNSLSLPEPRSDSTPPSAISDLSARASLTIEGAVTLSWTAPGDNGTVGTVSSYVLKTSTIGVILSSVFDNTSSATTYPISWTNFVSGGQVESRLVTGLSPGVTIYFALKAKDAAGNLSVWNSSADVQTVNTEAFALTLDLPPAQVTGLVAKSSNTAINLTWSASTSTDVSFYRILRDLVSGATTEIATTTSTFYSDTSLTNGKSYFYRIKTVDAPPALESDFSLQSSTVPNLRPGQNLFAVHNDTSVTLTWTAALDESAANFKLYNLRRGVASGGPYTVLVGTFAAGISSFLDTTHLLPDGTTSAVVPGTTYYYVIRSSGSATIPVSSGTAVEGLSSNEAVALPDIAPPEISFTPVTLFNFTGSPLTLKGSISDFRDFAKSAPGQIRSVKLYYQIVKSTLPTTVVDFSIPASLSLSKLSGTADIAASTLSLAANAFSTITYFVTAFDGTNTSTSSVVTLTVTKPFSQTVGSDGGTFSMPIPGGGEMVMEIPAGALSGDTVITANILDDNNPPPKASSEANIDLTLLPSGKPLSGYEFGPEGLVFILRPIVKLYYPSPDPPIDKDKLKVFLREGSKWTLQGGKANDKNQVAFKPGHFSKYAIFPAKSSTQKTTDKKFITPNGDGKNDSAGWSEFIKRVTIYDVTGLEIWTGAIDEFAKDQFGDVIQWNARDKQGVIVEGGTYIYRAEAINGDVTYGVIVVIR